jgi:hypothetical protein
MRGRPSAGRDGRVTGAPLAWFPRLAQADPGAAWAGIGPFGIHPAGRDEDVSVEGLLAGRARAGRG